jgi:hypothetical protein
MTRIGRIIVTTRPAWKTGQVSENLSGLERVRPVHDSEWAGVADQEEGCPEVGVGVRAG